MTDPFHLQFFLESKWQFEIRPSHQFIEDDPIVNPLDPHLAPVAIVK